VLFPSEDYLSDFAKKYSVSFSSNADSARLYNSCNFVQERRIITDRRRIIPSGPDGLLRGTPRKPSPRCRRVGGGVLMRNEGIINSLAGGRDPGPGLACECAPIAAALYLNTQNINGLARLAVAPPSVLRPVSLASILQLFSPANFLIHPSCDLRDFSSMQML